MEGIGVDAFRVSLSSAISSSSQGSGHDDGDALGDVFIWREGIGDGVIGGGPHRVGSSVGIKMDVLLPKALESAFVLDVQNIACGGRHAAPVTKQGEIFSWGEESGDADVLHPKLIDALSNTNIELVACGEYHSCVVTLSRDLYTWGDGHFGLLRHGNELFTFGDGTFGVLGHGGRESILKPREVELLKGLRTVRATCGVWHTATIVEVMVGCSTSSNCSKGKLFTWGDGDKGRIGHEDGKVPLGSLCMVSDRDREVMSALDGCATPPAEAEVQQEVIAMSQTNIFRLGIDVTRVVLLPPTTWRRHDKVEVVRPWKAKVYDMHNVVVRRIKSGRVPRAMPNDEF
ncbi:PH, RCC1 and FYVE domains-containing protein 1 [Sesamum alatum]|uniref:PH, RCC1 and FYVE domains-containing protein 1 n=1 Tax=Sesamum alatum TaxID=300844 RepID=A0AAE2CCL4_9LAMI|nr:PH, RCC1 and FYVE domains-containing protein 1 [Sesamum alatum]